MNKRAFWGGVAVLVGLYVLRMSLKMAEDMRRYNHILSLSNEGRVQDETPELLLQVMKQQKQTLKEWKNFMQSAPKDIMRYIKIETM
jgi:hypothetical protein